MSYEKVIHFSELNRVRNSLRGKKIVQCHGVFDVLHFGHIKHFEQAKKHGDVLIVTVTPDKFVNKGPGHPAFTERIRTETLAALDVTDYVLVNRWPTAVEAIQTIKPDVYVKGEEYRNTMNDMTGKILDEEKAVKSVGGKIKYTNAITFSSSKLINRYLPSFSEEVETFLREFRNRFTLDEIFYYLDLLKNLRVLVVGETIIDEYQFCEAMGKSGKEPVLASRYLSQERYAGGAMAVANHVSSFAKNVTVASFLGEHLEFEGFVRDSLMDGVKPLFFAKDHSPTIIKRRFIDHYLSQKMFEVYEMNDEALEEAKDRSFCQKLKKICGGFDVVIAADYGHGIISENAVDAICEKSRFLTVNTQANAGNHGLHTISKYPRADLGCIALRELQLEARSRVDEEQTIRKISRRMKAGRFILTRGNRGIKSYAPGEGFIETPALATKIKDRVGAGDTVLAVVSLLEAVKAPAELICFLGNVVGAEAVTVMGNKRFIEKRIVKKHVSHLLK